jgi:integrase
MRYRAPFTLIKRTVNKKKNLSVYYYRLSTDPARTMHSTGQANKQAARLYVEELLRHGGSEATLGDYQSAFWGDACQHRRRLADEGRPVTARYAAIQRRLLDLHLKNDPLCRKRLADIGRGDLLNYRSRLRDRLQDKVNTINKVMAALKTIFREALLRDDIDRDPCTGIGSIREQRLVRGVFTGAELTALFADCPGAWGSREAFTAFSLAASTGMRRGEVLALRWRALDLQAATVTIEAAWKGGDVIGTPKSGRARTAPLTPRMVQGLRDWFDESKHGGTDDFVFGGDVMRGETWWAKHFRRAMAEAGIAAAGRRLSPHSFRHTLNTLLRDSGMDPAKIREALGWAGERIQDQYTHWAAEHLREIGDEIGKVGL